MPKPGDQGEAGATGLVVRGTFALGAEHFSVHRQGVVDEDHASWKHTL